MATKTIPETEAAALALIAFAPSDDDHVAADLADNKGLAAQAEALRDAPALTGESHDELTIDRIYLPKTLRGICAMRLLAFFYGDDDRNAVLGANRLGVDADATLKAAMGESIVPWFDIRNAPRSTQQGLAMLLVVAIRKARAQGKVWRAVMGAA